MADLLEIDITNKITSLVIRKGEFTPEGEKDSIVFYQLVAGVQYDGDDDEIVIGKENKMATIAKLFKAADTQE